MTQPTPFKWLKAIPEIMHRPAILYAWFAHLRWGVKSQLQEGDLRAPQKSTA
jgi:hypothetical protein